MLETVGKKSLNGFVFEYELLNLLKKHPDFSDVKHEFVFKNNDRPVDIAAFNDGVTYIIECKGVSSFSNSRLNEIIKELINYRKELGPSVRLVLAFPGELNSYQQIQMKNNMIDIWDIFKIAEIFSRYISSIQSEELKQLLLSIKKDVFTIEDDFIGKLNSCPKGDKNWSVYQKLCANIFEHLFYPQLGRPIIELFDYVKANRRDIIMPNYSEDGYWYYMRQRYRADFLIIDAKNHATKIDKSVILQMGNYLKDYGAGMFGIISYRSSLKESVLHAQREIWVAQQKLIIFLNDSDLENMLKAKKNSNYPEEIIKQKIEDFRLRL